VGSSGIPKFEVRNLRGVTGNAIVLDSANTAFGMRMTRPPRSRLTGL